MKKYLLPLLCGLFFHYQTYASISSSNSFIIEYNANVPDSVKSCIEFSVGVWEQYITAKIPIKINVSWVDFANSANNVKAYAIPSEQRFNVTGLPQTNIAYPISLAENLLNSNLNGTSADVNIVINENVNWNIDYTLEVIDPLKTDLATIIIHEIAHGLGWIGNIQNEKGVYTLASIPTIYDSYVSYGYDVPLSPLLINKEISQDSIKALLTSDTLFWRGQYAKAFYNAYPKLFSPKTFDSGSTVYHLDEDMFPLGDINSLMTPNFTDGEVNRSPGLVTLAILADIGWYDFFIEEFPISNSQDVHKTTVIQVNFPDVYIDTSYVKTLYSYDNGINYDTLTMSYSVDSGSFIVELPNYPFEKQINYAFQTRSLTGDTIIFPPYFPYKTYSFFVGADNEPPVINLNKQSYVSIDKDSLILRASISDNFGIDSSYIQVIIGRNEFSTIITNQTYNFDQDAYGSYVVIPLSEFPIMVDDQIAYNIFSVDINGNQASLHEEGNFDFINIEDVQTPLNYFVTDFDSDTISKYFYLNDFSITKEDGFENKALHSLHPYERSFIEKTTISYTAELRNPIIIAENPATIEFDEVVLVEPGLTGVEYGDFGFWDYVAVEATTDKTEGVWYTLGKVGYDSQEYDEWTSKYYSYLIPGTNSSSGATGDASLYKHRVINLLENKQFRTGDTIYVRFGLYSDYDVYAWGWAIDNLQIQKQQSLSVEHIDDNLYFYPNPCNDMLCINNRLGVIECNIYNLLGEKIMSHSSGNVINISRLHTGVYYITIKTRNNTLTATFVKN